MKSAADVGTLLMNDGVLARPGDGQCGGESRRAGAHDVKGLLRAGSHGGSAATGEFSFRPPLALELDAVIFRESASNDALKVPQPTRRSRPLSLDSGRGAAPTHRFAPENVELGGEIQRIGHTASKHILSRFRVSRTLRKEPRFD